MSIKFLNIDGLSRLINGFNSKLNDKLKNKVDKESGKGLFSGKYSDLTGKPTIPTIGKLVTTSTSTQSSSSGEEFSGTINLHKISKTGSYNDLLNKPNIPDISNLVSNTRTIAGKSLSSNISASDLASALKVEIGKLMYPVDSILLSTSETNPATSLGFGTWVAWGAGRVPVGVNASDTNFNTVEKTGGNKSVSYTPAGTIEGTAITESQMPKHYHQADDNGVYHFSTIKPVSGTSGKLNCQAHSSGTDRWVYTSSDASNLANAVRTAFSGAGEKHSHTFTGKATTISTYQPYITCYMWKRTA